jgi:hypothetical protein
MWAAQSSASQVFPIGPSFDIHCGLRPSQVADALRLLRVRLSKERRFTGPPPSNTCCFMDWTPSASCPKTPSGGPPTGTVVIVQQATQAQVWANRSVDRHSPERLNPARYWCLDGSARHAQLASVRRRWRSPSGTTRCGLFAVFLDRPHEALHIGVTVWRAEQRVYDPDPSRSRKYEEIHRVSRGRRSAHIV